MRLLLLIPNLILLVISFYNLANDVAWKNGPNYLSFTVLHVLVMLMCLLFITLILKSVFRLNYVEGNEEAHDETLNTLAVNS